MKLISYIFACVFVILFACKDKENINPTDDLPPETQTGQQTFGCIVNEKAWVPSVTFPLIRLGVSYYQGFLGISAKLKTDSKYQTISIGKTNVIKPGVYTLSKIVRSELRLIDFNTQCTYDTDSLNIGVLEMTRVDTINMIFSGRFHFKIGVAGCDTIRVTDGRFDLRL
jgi:hypothetical protein